MKNWIRYRIVLPVLGTVGGLSLNLLFCFVWYAVIEKKRPRTETNSIPKEDSHGPPADRNDDGCVEIGGGDANPKPTKPKPQRPKIDYVNNGKIFATFLVVLCHVSQIMVFRTPLPEGIYLWSQFILQGTLQHHANSWFMQFFFFYSGYFVPKVCRRLLFALFP